MLKISILGATGYTGIELVRLLSRHPGVEIKYLTSETYRGQGIHHVFPGLTKTCEIICEGLDVARVAGESDVIFTAYPHGVSLEVVAKLIPYNKKIIDLSADYRLNDPQVYAEWYQHPHNDPEGLGQAVYGLTELYREKIKEAKLVANPGCYPTTAILGVAPLVKAGMVELDSIIIDAKSGVSGAGRNLSLTSHFAECNENLNPYKVGNHRHLPEIEQEISKLAGTAVKVSFTPHLVPMTRGMLSTIYLRPCNPVTTEQLYGLYQEFYRGEPFIRVLPMGTLPATKYTLGSNYCDLAVVADVRTGRIIVMVALDNLMKGAAGQAVQNMNLMCGLDEQAGLDITPFYP